MNGATVILFALDIEARPTLRLLRESRSVRFTHSRGRIGNLAGAQVLVAIIGAAGETKAELAAAEIVEHVTPSLLISAGFAGGLCDELRVGDLLLPHSVGNEQGEVIPLEAWGDENCRQLTPHQSGRLLSVSKFIGDVPSKRALSQRHEAVACDMETWAIANVCRRSGTAFRSVRIISDGVTDEFPPELPQLLEAPSSGRQALTAASAVLRRPALARDLWRLNSAAKASAIELAKQLVSLLPHVSTPLNGR